jgi:hypothetical protein
MLLRSSLLVVVVLLLLRTEIQFNLAMLIL